MHDLQTREGRMATLNEKALSDYMPVLFFVLCAFIVGVVVGVVAASSCFEKKFFREYSGKPSTELSEKLR